MTEEYPEPEISLLNHRSICIYMTDIPTRYKEKDIKDIFEKLSQGYFSVTEIDFVPCFYDPYDKKCAYVYFDNWFPASEAISLIECYFIVNTFYSYELPRTWEEYFCFQPKRYLKLFYVRKPISKKNIKRNWKLIEYQNIFQEMTRMAVKIRMLNEKVKRLEFENKNSDIYESEGYVNEEVNDEENDEFIVMS
jgi:hypothetical protein